jgi:hypothetical protein
MRIKLLVTSFLLLIGCTTVQNISPPPIDRIHKRAFALLKPLEHRVQAALRTIARRDVS